MHTFHTGGTGAGVLDPATTGPIRRMRGPYRAVAIFTTVLMLIGGFALMPIAAGAQPAEDEILEAVPEGDSVEFLGEQFEFDEATVPAEAPPEVAEPAVPAVNGADASGGGDLVQIIYAAAAMYGQSGDDLLRVAQCESTLNPNAYNASSSASGLFQFLPSTWATTPYADQNIFDPATNAQAAAWMWSVGRRGEWVCQ